MKIRVEVEFDPKKWPNLLDSIKLSLDEMKKGNTIKNYDAYIIPG